MEKEKKKFIIKPFNSFFWLIISLHALAFGILCHFLNRSLRETREMVIYVLSVINALYFLVYKIGLSKDEEYSVLSVENGFGAFNIWRELPFQLCNINIFMLPLGVATKNQIIMAASFFSSVIGATLALSMPCKGMEEGSYLMPRFYGFYGFHFLLVFTASLLMGLDLYTPQYGQVIPLLVTVYLEACFAFVISWLFRHLKLNDNANYFYVYGGEGNPVLDWFYEKIPVPLVYLLPVFILLIPVVYALMFVLRLF